MKDQNAIIAVAQSALEIEAKALLSAKERVGDHFAQAVEQIRRCRGRVVVTGVGKSALIAGKIVATFNSTGTPAVFMHAADAVHGDLGSVLPEDLLLILSNSGNSPEIKALVPYIKSQGNKILAIVGNKDSFLAKSANWIIDGAVEQEVMEEIMAPTSSTTLQLALGDALAVCLMKMKGFTLEDFAKNHPGGSIGKQITLTVGALLKEEHKAMVAPSASVVEVIYEISSKRVGATAVVEEGVVVGIITDGDIRRMLQAKTDIDQLTAKDIMSQHPKQISSNTLAKDALKLLNDHNINQVIVGEENYEGIIHLHELIKEGVTA